MEEASDVTPEYMVAVKREYLVPIKNDGRKTNLAASGGKTSESKDETEQTSDLAIQKEGNSLPAKEASDSAVMADNVGTVDGEAPEGYKSNGYKIDDRDRQQNSGWKNKKDYTGGKDAHHNNSQGSKKRPRDKDSRPESGDRLCSYVARSIACPWGGTCEYSHDPMEYLTRKVADIGPICYQYSVFGECQNGIMCRYGSQHINLETGISKRRSPEEGGVIEKVIINPLTKEVQSALRKKKYNFKARTDSSSSSSSSSSSTNDNKVKDPTSTATPSTSTSTILDEPASKVARLEDPPVQVGDNLSSSSVAAVVSSVDGGADSVEREEEGGVSALSAAQEVLVNESKVENIVRASASANTSAVELISEGVCEEKGEAAAVEVMAESTKEVESTPAPVAVPPRKSDGRPPKGDYNLTAYPQRMKIVDFSNKVYIAPLTTVGNLPWRRVMKDFGADITCGEMAMSHNLVMGQASEWARIRRHASEDIFGIQIAGGQPEHISKIAKLLENETSSDFVDLNCGCPLDTICNRGCGAILLNKPKKLVEIVGAMTKALNSRQVTVKIRTGWDDKNPSAHKLIPMLQKSAKGKIAAIMIHGRSRLQRYSKLANWEYVLQAARSQDPNYPRIPIIGNGDIFSWEDWNGHCDKIQSDVTGGSDNEDPEIIGLTSCAMLGRGALIKPWLPQELKEKRNIDISASERLEMLKKFVNYGLEHWGSDTQGVATTRSFLLEWLSFLHRYVPVALTERQQKMQQRPPQFFGRCDLETLMGSSNSNDWVRISEMLLGPVGDDFLFVAKHKSNSYTAEVNESNG